MRTLLRTVGQSLLRLMEQSEDALAVWDDALTDEGDPFTPELDHVPGRA